VYSDTWQEFLVEMLQTRGQAMGDEVHLVPQAGERLAQLGGDDAAAAGRRVADDSDVCLLHGRRTWVRLRPRKPRSPRAPTVPAA